MIAAITFPASFSGTFHQCLELEKRFQWTVIGHKNCYFCGVTSYGKVDEGIVLESEARVVGNGETPRAGHFVVGLITVLCAAFIPVNSVTIHAIVWVPTFSSSSPQNKILKRGWICMKINHGHCDVLVSGLVHVSMLIRLHITVLKCNV